MKCKCCGNDRFIGHQIIRADVEVDGYGRFIGNLFGGLEAHIYDSGIPYGSFTCTKCGAEYEDLSKDAVPTNMKFKDGQWVQNGSEEPVKISSVLEATYTEVWEETMMITSACLVDLKTRQIIAISRNGDTTIDTGECESDVSQYVTIADQDYRVIDKDEFQEDYAENWNPDDPDSCDVFWME